MKTQRNDGSELVEIGIQDVNFSEIGTKVEGELIRRTEVLVGDKLVNKFYVTNDSQIYGFLSTAQLERTLNVLPLGSYVVIERVGSAKTRNGSNMHTFKILVQKQLAESLAAKQRDVGDFTEAIHLQKLADNGT